MAKAKDKEEARDIDETPEDNLIPEGQEPSDIPITPSQSEDFDLDMDVNTESELKPHFRRPAVICGVCEACGSSRFTGKVVKSLDKNGETVYKYVGGKWETINATNCPHYGGLYKHGMAIRCMGCNEVFTGARNRLAQFSEVLATREVVVLSLDSRPKTLIMYCDQSECISKRFKYLKNA